MCAICLMEFEAGESVLRLFCRHICHTECWTSYLTRASSSQISCPACRGSARVIARWLFIPPLPEAQIAGTATAAAAAAMPSSSGQQTAASRESSMHSASSHHALIWGPADAEQPSGYYHASTQLPDGRLSILVDPGAWTNLRGADTIRKMADAARRAGHRPQQWRMERPLQIMGVGNGTQACNYEVKVPFAFRTEEGHALCSYNSPTVGGAGSQLPALLGLRSIEARGGVLETRDGNQCLTLPGPGGYTIHWSPGTVRYPLVKAPSGHLVIPFGDLSQVPTPTGGLPRTPTAFMANPTEPARDEAQLGSTPAPESLAASSSP